MTTAKKILGTAFGEEESKLYVDDVFSTYLYAGNGSTQTINNGIDLAGKGGLVWLKQRSGTGDHLICDTERPDATGTLRPTLKTNTNGAQTNINSVGDFLSNGFTVGNDSNANASGQTYASWTFRKAPKFFDVVTYTGNDSGNRSISHSLGLVPGLIVIKRTDTSGLWVVYHKDLTYTKFLKLNTTEAQADTANSIFGAQNPTTSAFFVGPAADVNASGATYVAYLWAHDPSEDGIIQCGSYVGNGSVNGPEVTLGWEPQYLLVKSASAATGWHIMDSMRGLPVNAQASVLWAEATSQELTPYGMSVNAQGFSPATANGNLNTNGSSYIYLAIRRPNKPPKMGAEVYNAIARTGTGASAVVTGVGFSPDVAMTKARDVNYNPAIFDRLRGENKYFDTTSIAAEQVVSGLTAKMLMDGVDLGGHPYLSVASNLVHHFFRRAPGFFDVVCYTGTGVARTVQHNLGVAPELMIVKARDTAGGWYSYWSPLTINLRVDLNDSGGPYTGLWENTKPTEREFTVNATGGVNSTGTNHVTYLFASLPGVSKVGAYTGNGTTQTIPCGFTTGARFILIKRTDSAGDWYVWDTARGIVAANDPHLSLNTTAAEVTTDDSVDPHASGFIVNQNTATNINVSGGQYIFLSVA